MAKEDIYTKIEYNGKYDTKIKTNLRNMIKENKDNKELYSLLLEVQNELETGKAKGVLNKLKKQNTDAEPKITEDVKKTNKKEYIKKEKSPKPKKKAKKKKIPVSTILTRIFIVLFILLMVASSLSTIFSYFN